MISQIIANFICESENQNIDNLCILWSSYKTEMSFEFWKKVVHEKLAKYHAISHTLICNFILLSFGICVCIWKAVKALANKGGLGAWGRCNLNSAGRQISTQLPANMDNIPLQKHIQKFE